MPKPLYGKYNLFTTNVQNLKNEGIIKSSMYDFRVGPNINTSCYI